MLPPILAFSFVSVAFAASFACAPTVAGGQVFDLAHLSGSLVFADTHSWAYHLSICGPAPEPPAASCAKGALAHQITTHDGNCFTLGWKRGAAKLAGAGPLLLELVGGDACGGSSQRFALLELTCAVGATTVVSVEENCGACCYRARLSSPAGCAAAACPVDPRTQLVCGGPSRGKCRPDGGGTALGAVCECVIGTKGNACSDDAPAAVSLLPAGSHGYTPALLLLLLLLLPAAAACAALRPPHARASGLLPNQPTSAVLRRGPVLALLATFLVAFTLWGSFFGTAPYQTLNPAAPALAATSAKSAADAVHARAVNLLAPALLLRHHPVFSSFVPFSGAAEPGFVFDFLGMRTAVEHMCNPDYMWQTSAHALRVQNCLRARWDEPGEAVEYTYPLVGEEYVEYVSVLQSAVNFPRGAVQRPYAFIEIGCGYCHWSVSAALAARAQLGAAHPVFILAFDGGRVQVARCATHLENNRLEGVVRHSAVVSGDEPTISFSCEDTYGCTAGRGPLTVPATNLARILSDPLVPPIVDMIDTDIQGGEEFIFDGHMELLSERVKRVHVGTHGLGNYKFLEAPGWAPGEALGNTLEKKVEAVFAAAGWTQIFAHHRQTLECEPDNWSHTPWGPICFADGALSFENPRLMGK